MDKTIDRVLLPTPRAQDATSGSEQKKTFLNEQGSWRKKRNGVLYGARLGDLLGARPSPEFVEWMMGYPIGWTKLGANE